MDHHNHVTHGNILSPHHNHNSQMNHASIFQNSNEVTILFAFLSTDKGLTYSIILLVCYLSGIMSVVLEVLRDILNKKLLKLKPNQPVESFIFRTIILNFLRAIPIIINLTWDFCLMLAVMSFNVGVFFSIVFGVGTGFICLGHLLITRQKIICCCGRQKIEYSNTAIFDGNKDLNNIAELQICDCVS